MKLLLSTLSSAIFASLAAARLPYLAQCGTPDIRTIPCDIGNVCTAVNSTVSQCLPVVHAGTKTARAVRRAEVDKRAGEGGQINLVNGTPFKFVLDHTNSYQLNEWGLPAEVLPFTSASAYVEFKTGIFVNPSDAGAEALYRLDGTDHTFEIQASGNGGFHLQVVLTGLSTHGNDQGSTINLGWNHDGWVNFALSGVDDGSFISSNPPQNWMSLSLPTFGDTPLSQFVLPASHDSGMSLLDGTTGGSRDCNTLTQTVAVRDQLARGARYFDVRPVIAAGAYKTGHYSKLALDGIIETWQGGNGQSIDAIIDEVNAFTQDKSELVIINLSHDLNTDVGNADMRGFNQDEWNALFDKLQRLNNLYTSESPTTDLKGLPLKAFIGEHSAVVVVVEGSADLGDRRGKGFFTYDQLGPYNSYSDSNDLGAMSGDQLQKMRDQAANYMLLSWTLTQKVDGVILCPAAPSIVALADKANGALFSTILNEANRDAYPKLLYIDNFAYADMIPLALGLNYKIRA